MDGWINKQVLIVMFSFYPSLHEAIVQEVASGRTLTEREITNLAHVLDGSTSGLPSRLSTKSFVLVFAVLRVSEPCWSQQRGLCLLAVTNASLP